MPESDVAKTEAEKSEVGPSLNPRHDRIVWIDCEMTGLDGGTEEGADLLVEIAALVTDSELNVLGDGVDIVIGAPDEALDSMNDVVKNMHASSGLTDEIRASRVTVAEAQKAVLDYVRAWVEHPGSAPLAGNSIATDRKFIARDMPELDEYLHYRMIDVSSIKELCRRWYPRIYFGSPAKHGGHRALADIHESIDELRYYRAAMLVPAPGPDSPAVKAVREKIVASSVSGTITV